MQRVYEIFVEIKLTMAHTRTTPRQNVCSAAASAETGSEIIMMRFVEWLKAAFGKTAPEPPVRYRPPLARAKPPRPTKQKRMPEIVDFIADVGGQVEDAGPGKNVLIRNKYVREETGTHETLKIVDDSLLESKDEPSADPYNTGRFDRSKSWDSFRTRK